MSAADQTQRYVLLIPVPREVEIRIEDRFLDLSGATKPMMGYHITLLGSFLLPEGTESECLGAIAQTCSSFQPFELTIGGLGAFESPGNHTIYVPVIKTAPIKGLQRALWQALDQRIDFVSETTRAWNLPDRYHPHITLGLGLSDAEYHAFMHSGAEQGCAATFAVTQINLVAQRADGPWQNLAHYYLGQPPSASPDEVAY